MIDPNRVGRIVCLPGERVRAELGFRWDAEPQVVQASFRKFVGSRFSARHLGRHIALEGREFSRCIEEGEAYTSVILEGVIRDSKPFRVSLYWRICLCASRIRASS